MASRETGRPSLTLPPSRRLTHDREYQAVHAGRMRTVRGALVLACIPNARPHHRLGLAVGKRVGNAVMRARQKRWLREAFRQLQHELPLLDDGTGLDLVLSVRSEGLTSLEDARRSLREAFGVAHATWRKRLTRGRAGSTLSESEPRVPGPDMNPHRGGARMGKFVVKKASDGQFYFRLQAGNGEPILKSEMYKAKDSCMNGIESVKKNSSDPARYEKKTDKSGQPYFVLKAGNHEIIGVSESYSSEDARDNGIQSVMANGPTSEIDDQSAA